MRYRLPALLLALAALALVVAGCGGDDDETAPDEPVVTEPAEENGGQDGGGGGEVTEVSMTEYDFDPADFTVSRGDTIEAVNDGEIVHNLTVQDDGLATADIQPGESGEVTVDLQSGTYDYICTIANHAELGMTGTLTVE